MNMFSSMI